jgi:redox-sensitive bicupin YhaK (pirin superfamily)
MINVRRSSDRGHADWGWLDTHHTFSFGDYNDPRFMGFRVLRVINEDRVQAGQGFGTHPHRDMEILTYVIEGSLAHKDSMGTGAVIRPGDVQRMSAGTGVTHSEFNASKADPVHFLQIWIIPDRRNAPPGYEQKTFADAEKRGKLRLVASGDGRDGSVTWNQQTDLYVTLLEPGNAVSHALKSGRHAWVQVVDGVVTVGGQALSAGDGAAISDEKSVAIEASTDAEVLMFDLP